jgi:hypothetical protein
MKLKIKEEFRDNYLNESLFLQGSAGMSFFTRRQYFDSGNEISNDDEFIRKHHPEWIEEVK